MKKIKRNENELYWKRIQLISFVLAVFIIIRHNSSVANYDFPLMASVYWAIKNSITEVAVPLFFLISGLHFFRNYSPLSQKRKLKSRVKSLLIPYLAWNSIYCVFYIITSLPVFTQYFIGREKFEVTPLNVFMGCIFHNNCNSHFWFVFDLMVCVVLNFVVFYIIRSKIAGTIFLSILFVVIFIIGLALPVNIFYRTDAFFYYYLGAFLGMHYSKLFSKDVLWKQENETMTGTRKIFGLHFVYFLIGLICLFACVLLLLPGLHNGVKCFLILLSAFGLWILSSCCRFIGFNCLPQGGTTFLMYAAHGIIQPIIVKLIYLVFPKAGWMSFVNFLLSIVLTVIACIGFRYLIKRFLPPIDKVLTGWRR